MELNIVWHDRKRLFCGLPWTFTKYTLTHDKLLIDSGFFSSREEEIRLYRIMDISLRRSLIQRLFGLGTIHCCSADKTSPEFDIKNIRNSQAVKNRLSDLVEENRQKNHVIGREYLEADDEE